MDTLTQDQQQKDFMSTFFPPSTDQNGDPSHHQQSLFNGAAGIHGHGMHSSSLNVNTTNLSMDMDVVGNFMTMQGIEGQQPLSPSQTSYSPQALLEQQFKVSQLQQLQQLQNQIFLQQIALISGQPGSNASEMSPESNREQRLSHPAGLPTPGPSSELRPQQNNEYVSPMILQYMDTPQETYQSGMQQGHSQSHLQSQSQSQSHQSHQSNSTHYHHLGSNSAPANIAFQTNSGPLSAGDLDFDISPLTSPWLGAHQHSSHPRQANKRTASPSGDEGSTQPSRKRHSPAIRPSNPTHSMKKNTQASKSTTSTPLLRSTRSRRNSTVLEDTPSPVDLSMPPPAPVTPASIMNLERLGLNSGLTPITTQDSMGLKQDGKGRSTVRPKTAGEITGIRKTTRKTLPSPSLKAILPAGDASSLHIGPSASHGEPPRKTSHKAAEQKRRDSLKTTFDDLRHLLPPIPLPSDENFPDEPILPGALPPRGPPKAGGEGPNKGVSKLQLLRCGNDFIRQLKGRVERRDVEINKLRREVMRLRGFSGNLAPCDEEELDLDRDLDANEAVFGRGSAGDDDADEEDGD